MLKASNGGAVGAIRAGRHLYATTHENSAISGVLAAPGLTPVRIAYLHAAHGSRDGGCDHHIGWSRGTAMGGLGGSLGGEARPSLLRPARAAGGKGKTRIGVSGRRAKHRWRRLLRIDSDRDAITRPARPALPLLARSSTSGVSTRLSGLTCQPRTSPRSRHPSPRYRLRALT